MDPLTDERRVQLAEQASLLATFSVVLCMVGSCAGPITLLFALPLSLWGLKLTRDALAGTSIPELAKAYASPARGLHIAVVIYSGSLLLFYLGFVLLYMGMVVALVTSI